MTTFRIATQQPNATNEFIAEAFNGATIALLAVLAALTWAMVI
jgi:hypothetical protein